MTKFKTIGEIAREFQDEMQKMNLGVSFSTDGRDPIRVTTYCEACKQVAKGDTPVCVSCGADIPKEKP